VRKVAFAARAKRPRADGPFNDQTGLSFAYDSIPDPIPPQYSMESTEVRFMATSDMAQAQSGTMQKTNRKLAIEEQIWQTLTDGTPVVLTSHQGLDPDGLGSALGLWHALRTQNVPCYQLYPPPLPEAYDFLPGVEEARYSADALPGDFNLVMIDCGAFDRVGDLAGPFERANTLINIDHHATNDYFGDLCLVEENASSCGELVYRIIEIAGVPVTKDAAECIYAAILSDTGKFTYHNTNAEVFRICHKLVLAGTNPTKMANRIYASPTLAEVRLKAEAVKTLDFKDEGKIGLMRITEEMFRNVGLDPVDCHGFADIPASVRGVEVGVLLKEMPEEDYIDISLRSRDHVDVCQVAGTFGGGGHRHAAGCEIVADLDEAQEMLVQTIRRQIEKDLGC